nr:AzlC family ABC transporter permease [Dickeya oryzae]
MSLCFQHVDNLNTVNTVTDERTPEHTATKASFVRGLFDSLPIVIGYVPVAFAFGLNAVKLGFTPLEAIFLSCVIYAGASQFVITALLSAGASIWVAALTVMAMDVRHVLYGPSLRHRIRQRLPTGKTVWWAFGLTDEVFAAATVRLSRDNRRWSESWMLGVAINAWLSWVAGTILGALFGNGPLNEYPAVEAALSFMLPALFLSFLLASFKRRQSLVVATALGGASLGLLASSIPAAILVGIVGGCLASLYQPARLKEETP